MIIHFKGRVKPLSNLVRADVSFWMVKTQNVVDLFPIDEFLLLEEVCIRSLTFVLFLWCYQYF